MKQARKTLLAAATIGACFVFGFTAWSQRKADAGLLPDPQGQGEGRFTASIEGLLPEEKMKPTDVPGYRGGIVGYNLDPGRFCIHENVNFRVHRKACWQAGTKSYETNQLQIDADKAKNFSRLIGVYNAVTTNVPQHRRDTTLILCEKRPEAGAVLDCDAGRPVYIYSGRRGP
jgi:hypothetical protein